MSRFKTANLLRNFARYFLLILGILVFVFALLSGAEQTGGIKGIIVNSPNALPWLVFLFIVWLAWKKELIGGIVIILFSVAASILFSIWNDLFEFSFWLVLVILICGIFLILSWKLRK
ncbi:MAG: hypothetical protein DRH79_04855 [Candidatus Cloacimonadota bacterium]|nr:MAG: hypothetical protein DRH79_04855 [Candidatus Cloacimonadota bacterium]